jgi:hypothetical protein
MRGMKINNKQLFDVGNGEEMEEPKEGGLYRPHVPTHSALHTHTHTHTI